jgi:hypothetical protein
MEDQVLPFGRGQAEGKLFQKTIRIAIHRLIQIAGGDAIHACQVAVKHDCPAPDMVYAASARKIVFRGGKASRPAAGLVMPLSVMAAPFGPCCIIKLSIFLSIVSGAA